MDLPLKSIAVCLNPDEPHRSHRLATQLQLPLIDVPNKDDLVGVSYGYLLIYTPMGLALQQTGCKASGSIVVDFVSSKASYRRSKGGGELLVKAVGGNTQQRPTVVDATAGFGSDSFVLASWGYFVTLCERSPLVGCLLEDGLQRAKSIGDCGFQKIINRMHLMTMDAVDYLQQLGAANLPDVVVIDPMFPPSKKKSLVKKEMRALQQLVGIDQDVSSLLLAALVAARHRVVVKRPIKGKFLLDREPSFSLNGRVIRYDIYAIKTFGK